ncbi:MAG: V-type ATP synthase subunit E [Lachnospiraceae bacterium]|nr:V-type ATP synthase subunit E [Lachnospiraceae bacterium]
MTTDEKLQHFLDICMEDARDRSGRLFDEYAKGLEKTLEEHKTDARRRARMQIQGETEKIEREMNKELAVEQINLRRAISQRQNELTDMLFVELKDMLANYMETSRYLHLLDAQIKHAKEFAGQEELIIYMDPSDADKANRLAMQNNARIKISEYSFGGGTRAVIPSRHILIDNSFETKLAEAKQAFRFETGGKNHG